MFLSCFHLICISLKISFTGSIATGKDIRAHASLKRITLEMGGNDAAICLDDANPAEIAPKILHAAMMNSGQVCIAVKRCYVPRNRHDEYIDEFKKAASGLTVGNGFNKGTTMGPINNKMQFDRICDLVVDAKKNGATIEHGGKPIEDTDGYFFPPTIVSNVSSKHRIVAEEQFGPVLPIIPYDSEEDAIKEANGTAFGLGGSVWGEEGHAASVARHIGMSSFQK